MTVTISDKARKRLALANYVHKLAMGLHRSTQEVDIVTAERAADRVMASPIRSRNRLWDQVRDVVEHMCDIVRDEEVGNVPDWQGFYESIKKLDSLIQQYTPE